MICVAVFLDTLLYGIIVPAVPYYVAWLGTDTAELGIIFAAYSVGVLLTSIPAGILCDRIGHKKVLLLGQAGLGLATAAFILSGSVAALTISRFLQGVASAATWTAGLALATELFPSAERGKKLGLVMSAAGLGTIAGPIFGGVLFDRLGYTYPFVAVAILAGILLVWIPSIPVETAPGAFEAHNKAPSSRSPLRDAFKNTNLLWGSVTVATGSFGFGVLGSPPASAREPAVRPGQPGDRGVVRHYGPHPHIEPALAGYRLGPNGPQAGHGGGPVGHRRRCSLDRHRSVPAHSIRCHRALRTDSSHDLYSLSAPDG
jgi:multidrug resistance protein